VLRCLSYESEKYDKLVIALEAKKKTKRTGTASAETATSSSRNQTAEPASSQTVHPNSRTPAAKQKPVTAPSAQNEAPSTPKRASNLPKPGSEPQSQGRAGRFPPSNPPKRKAQSSNTGQAGSPGDQNQGAKNDSNETPPPKKRRLVKRGDVNETALNGSTNPQSRSQTIVGDGVPSAKMGDPSQAELAQGIQDGADNYNLEPGTAAATGLDSLTHDNNMANRPSANKGNTNGHANDNPTNELAINNNDAIITEGRNPLPTKSTSPNADPAAPSLGHDHEQGVDIATAAAAIAVAKKNSAGRYSTRPRKASVDYRLVRPETEEFFE
jgi:hypothetical protein